MRQRFSSVLLVVALFPSSEDVQAQARELPQQQIVFLIDNSNSMKGSDPLGLRGVAANLILDAAELSSQVEAGAVFFSDGVTVHELGDPERVREKLMSGTDRPSGGTNMQAALEAALDLLRGSTGPTRRIVMITDGRPSNGVDPAYEVQQTATILGQLVEQAIAADIQIFALGLSDEVNVTFLREVTTRTGGKTVLSADHSQLLEGAKEVLGDRDNVYLIERDHLDGTRLEYRFELPPGVDRARVTAVLDDPQLFGVDQIAFDVAQATGRDYSTTREGRSFAAAWTGFLSSPGTFTLAVRPDKPGLTDSHRGLEVFVEALSVFDVDVTLTPSQRSYTFGDEVRVRVAVTTAGGSLDAQAFQVSGEVRTAGGGAKPIPFTGAEGLFRVPDVSGGHTVEVTLTTSRKLGRATASVHYTAVPPQAVELASTRPEIVFADRLSGEAPYVEEAFKIYFVEGERRQRIQITTQLSPPRGFNDPKLAQLLTERGQKLETDGTRAYVLPPEGLDLTLRLAMDSERPFAVPEGLREGEIRISSDEAVADLIIPFQVHVRRPSLEIAGGSNAFALWWDPDRSRTISLGRIETDARIDSSIHVVLPESISAPDGGPEIAGLVLGLDGVSDVDTELRQGRQVIGPVNLPKGKTLPMRLTVEPSANRSPRKASSREIPVTAESHFGVDATAEPTFTHLGGPFWTVPLLGPFSFHGRHLATWLLVGLGLLLVLSFFSSRVRQLATFHRFRPGTVHTVGPGALQVGDPRLPSTAALVLPNAGVEEGGFRFGEASVSPRGRQQVRDETGERLRVMGRPVPAWRELCPGETLTVWSTDNDDEPLWELAYLDSDDGAEQGEIEIEANPVAVSWSGALFRLIFGMVVLLVVRWLMGTGLVADLAYRIPFADWLYTDLVFPLLSR